MAKVSVDVMSIGSSVAFLGREIMTISTEWHPHIVGGPTARMTSHGCCHLMTVVSGDVIFIERSVACLGRKIVVSLSRG